MYHCLVLVSALLNAYAGGSLVHGPSEKVLALAGANVILPCTFNITSDDEFPTVEWSKEGLQPNVVFLYRDGREIHGMKNPAFTYRTSLIMKELKNRNFSLRISNVQLSDAGKYQCMRLRKNPLRDITTVELVVGAASEPRLSAVAVERGGVTLQCEAECWMPKPEITFLDHQGNHIPAEEPKRHYDEDAGGCFNVIRKVTLWHSTNGVTCRVHQPEINQTMDRQILIAADKTPWILTTSLAVGGIASLLFVSGFIFLLKRRGKSARGPLLSASRHSSDHSTMSQPFLTVRADMVDNAGSTANEDLRREVADLKSKLREKEGIIRKLQNNNMSQPCGCQLGQPVMVSSPAASSNPLKSVPRIPRIHRIQSSPAVIGLCVAELSHSSSVRTSKKMLGNIGRSASESSAWPGPRVSKLKRRNSLGLLLPTPSSIRFPLLTHLSEESE